MEIERTRHLDVLRVSLEKVHASPCCLYGRGIVREKSIIALGLRAGILEYIGPEHLRRLHRHELRARHRHAPLSLETA